MMGSALNLMEFSYFCHNDNRSIVDFSPLMVLDNCQGKAIIANNNTPPASRQISAPRGVTRFWGAEK